VPFEEAWMSRISNLNTRMKVVDLRAGVDDDHFSDGLDPHIWTNPVLMKLISKSILDELLAADPGGKRIYQQNYGALISDLEVLDNYIKQRLQGITRREFYVFHPSWGHFAKHYGLTQIAIEREGKEPTPQALAQLIADLKTRQIKVIYTQPQFSRTQAQMIADAVGAHLETIDPLAEDYIDNMKKVADNLANTLGVQ